MTATPLKQFLIFAAKFLALFFSFYLGLLLLTGLAVRGGNYNAFIAAHLDPASAMRTALIDCTRWLLQVFGTQTYRPDAYTLRMVDGRGIRLVYSCLGFAVLSFWLAYSLASGGTARSRSAWAICGLLAIFLINVARLALVLKFINSGITFPFGWDHHTWFNIISYLFIFGMIIIHERTRQKSEYVHN